MAVNVEEDYKCFAERLQCTKSAGCAQQRLDSRVSEGARELLE